MLVKRCITMTKCDYERHCVYKHQPAAQVTQFFSPPHAGEHCHYYEPVKTDIDHHDEIMAKMGAHQ